MDDVREEQGALRRTIRRIEDDVANIERKKANHDDVEAVVSKQSSMDTFVRTRLDTLQNANDDIHTILKRISETLSSIDDRVTKLKRDTDTELQAVKAPSLKPELEQDRRNGVPTRVQLVMWMLAGVGLLALLQGAPQALLQVFPGLGLGIR